MNRKKNILIFCLLLLIFITVIFTSIIILNNKEFNKYIATYNTAFKEGFKEGFYEEFDESFFPAFKDGLIDNGYTKESVDEYISKLQSEFNLTKLENETWGCLSQYSFIQMFFMSDKISDECFDKWISDFLEENKDAASILKMK